MVSILKFYGLFALFTAANYYRSMIRLWLAVCMFVLVSRNRSSLMFYRRTVLLPLVCNCTPNVAKSVVPTIAKPLIPPFDSFAHLVRLLCVHGMLRLTPQEGNSHWNLNFVSGKFAKFKFRLRLYL